MNKLKRYLSPRVVMISSSVLLLSLGLLSLFPPGASEATASATAEWFAERDRVRVDLFGTLQDVEGRSVRLEDLKAKILLLNFWATWCGPCLMEMPSLASLQEDFGEKGLRIVAVTEEDLSTVSMFLERNPYPFTVLVDNNGKLSERLGVWAIPLTLILDKNRKLVHFHQGARVWDTPDIEEELNRLVSE